MVQVSKTLLAQLRVIKSESDDHVFDRLTVCDDSDRGCKQKRTGEESKIEREELEIMRTILIVALVIVSVMII